MGRGTLIVANSTFTGSPTCYGFIIHVDDEPGEPPHPHHLAARGEAPPAGVKHMDKVHFSYDPSDPHNKMVVVHGKAH